MGQATRTGPASPTPIPPQELLHARGRHHVQPHRPRHGGIELPLLVLVVYLLAGPVRDRAGSNQRLHRQRGRVAEAGAVDLFDTWRDHSLAIEACRRFEKTVFLCHLGCWVEGALW